MKLLQLSQLFAMPLQSAVRAQNLAVQETISFIEQFGIEEGTAKTFRFKAERMVEERKIDPKTGKAETRLKVEPFDLNIPLLAMIQPPNIILKEMDIEFGIEVVVPKTENIKSEVIPLKVLGTSHATSSALFSTLGQSNPTTMKVNMKIVREIPEGMARLVDVLTDLLSGQPPSPPKVIPTVDKIPGIGRERATLLNRVGIPTIAHLIRATETEEGIQKLAKVTHVSPRIIVEWREKAKLLMK